MPAMFKRNDINVKNAFSADTVKLSFTGSEGGGNGITGALVQGFNFTFQQQLSRLYEIGGNGEGGKQLVYHVGGRAQGQAQLNRVIGPLANIKTFYEVYGDVCICDNHITMEIGGGDGCCQYGDITYQLRHCVLTQVGVSVQAQDMLINEMSQLMFSGCDVS